MGAERQDPTRGGSRGGVHPCTLSSNSSRKDDQHLDEPCGRLDVLHKARRAQNELKVSTNLCDAALARAGQDDRRLVHLGGLAHGPPPGKASPHGEDGHSDGCVADVKRTAIMR